MRTSGITWIACCWRFRITIKVLIAFKKSSTCGWKKWHDSHRLDFSVPYPTIKKYILEQKNITRPTQTWFSLHWKKIPLTTSGIFFQCIHIHYSKKMTHKDLNAFIVIPNYPEKKFRLCQTFFFISNNCKWLET